MRLTRSEIRANALKFAQEWRDAADEQADAQSFWTELFAVLGVTLQDRSDTPLERVPFRWTYGRVEVTA